MHFMTKFGAIQLQGAVFFRDLEEAVTAEQAWNILALGAPQSTQKDTETPMQTEMHSGRWNNYRITIRSQVGRLDMILAALPSEMLHDLPQVPPLIRDVGRAVEDMKNLVGGIVSDRGVSRIGLIAELLKPVNSVSVNSALQAELKTLEFPPDAQEIAVKFNVQRKFKFDPSITMNRLVSWETGQMSRLDRRMPFHLAQSMLMGAQSVVKFSIDINSMAEANTLLNDPISVLNEVSSELIDIEENGIGSLK